MRITPFAIILSLLLLVSALSQEEAPAEPTYDYTDDTNYQNPDFYTDSDPSRWDWRRVDWNQVNFEQAELYDLSDFYTNLPAERYSSLNYRLVPDFGLITDHSLIDGTKFAQDFGCRSCQLESGTQRSLLQYDERGQILHTTTNDHVFAEDFPAATQFTAQEWGIDVQYAEGTTAITVPERGRFTAVLDSPVLYESHTLEGLLSFKDGQPFLIGSAILAREVTINGIVIRAPDISQVPEIPLFFDGQEHEGNYISIDQEAGLLRLKAPTFYEFLPGNPFFDVEEEDHLLINSYGETEILVQREEDAPVPTVTVHPEGEGIQLEIENGRLRLALRDTSQFFLDPPHGEERGSVPFELLVQDDEGNILLGTPEALAKIVFDNQQDMFVIPPDLAMDEYTDFRESIVLFNFLSSKIFEISNIEAIGGTQNAITLGSFLYALQSIPPGLRESVRAVNFLPSEELQRACRWEGSAGCTNLETREVFLPEQFPPEQSVLKTTAHEFAHAFTEQVRQGETESTQELRELTLELMNRYQTKDLATAPLTNDEQEELQELQVETELGLGETFIDRWQRLAGPVYGKSNVRIQEFEIEGRTFTGFLWTDCPTAEADALRCATTPRYGCPTAYACTSIDEDIAVHIEAATGGVWEPLVTPGSPVYNEINVEKYRLLCEREPRVIPEEVCAAVGR